MVKIVGVKFLKGVDAWKTYRFKTDLELRVNDYIVVRSVNRCGVAKVSTLEPPNHAKWIHGTAKLIVDKFDANEHERRIEIEKEKNSLLEKMKKKKDKFDVLELYLLLSKYDGSMRGLFEEYLTLLSEEEKTKLGCRAFATFAVRREDDLSQKNMSMLQYITNIFDKNA